MKEKVVLAYSGGLDTTTLIPWLKETFDYEVICCCIDCGQGEELDGLMKEQNSQVLLNYTSKISLMISVTTILCHVYRQMLFTKMHTFSELLWLVRQSPRDLLK